MSIHAVPPGYRGSLPAPSAREASQTCVRCPVEFSQDSLPERVDESCVRSKPRGHVIDTCEWEKYCGEAWLSAASIRFDSSCQSKAAKITSWRGPSCPREIEHTGFSGCWSFPSPSISRLLAQTKSWLTLWMWYPSGCSMSSERVFNAGRPVDCCQY